MTKAIIYIGILLAFLAVPVGSYFMVKHYSEQVTELKQKNRDLTDQNTEFVDRIEFEDKIKNATKDVEPEHDVAIEKNLSLGKQIDDLIRSTPSDATASENTKKTLKALKEIADE
ncbi:hypothetical protein PP940_gp064 [Rhizobium phage RL2RES]|uniref:Uncharacterized protein n=1 Tax=Rhizobium phage RL2RES TaxID=103371 RepID=A0A6B9J462_9CAUD|nr:hypothetical protein PP940_gp064 [Rhizobium phage RL2RES]QGZ14238.1 hypothetical protein RL2RES_064 [Rhizobium phage RL2RES]